jgi:hypothetical protein
MARALGVFLLVFALLSLLVHLEWICAFLGVFAALILVLSFIFEEAGKHSNHRTHRAPLGYR